MEEWLKVNPVSTVITDYCTLLSSTTCESTLFMFSMYSRSNWPVSPHFLCSACPQGQTDLWVHTFYVQHVLKVKLTFQPKPCISFPFFLFKTRLDRIEVHILRWLRICTSILSNITSCSFFIGQISSDWCITALQTVDGLALYKLPFTPLHLWTYFWHTLSLSVLAAIFQVNLGLLVFIEAKDDGGGGDNWSYKSCKAPVKSSPPTNQHPVFLQAGWPSCRPTNSVKALKGSLS